jgi:hypothetical protein
MDLLVTVECGFKKGIRSNHVNNKHSHIMTSCPVWPWVWPIPNGSESATYSKHTKPHNNAQSWLKAQKDRKRVDKKFHRLVFDVDESTSSYIIY